MSATSQNTDSDYSNEASVIAFLDSTGVPYEVVEIDPEFADTAAFCEKYGFPMENSANTIIVASKKKPKTYTASVVRATHRVDVNHVIKPLMDIGKVSFARPEETAELTGMMIGGVTALALPPELPIFVDSGLMTLDYIILGGGSRSIKIKISPKIFGSVPNASVVEGLTGE
jgi:prolyl-tRNA editing enzyme YbaK/EbsC (Cys-tRNA(Pro) deacylase)